MNNFGRLTMGDAIKIVNDYDAMPIDVFEANVASKWKSGIIDMDGLSDYDISIRNRIKEEFDLYYPETGGNRNKMYPLDLNIGLVIYELLDPARSDFSISDASDDDMWRYISVKVIPDLTYLRYPAKSETGAKNINKKRFYSETRRIWIKSLWWYVFLAWQGTREQTYEVLKDNSIDNINKFIETPGRGYRLTLYRALMAEYSHRPHNTKYFAGVTKLNNAKCKTITPSLMVGGEEAYVSGLFDEVPIAKEQEDETLAEE